MNLDIDLYEALVDAGVSKDKARDVVLAQRDSMDQLLTTLATKTELAEFRTDVDGRFNVVKTELAEFRAYVDGRFNLVEEQMTSVANRIVIRLGALMVVLTGLVAVMLGLMHR
jgi:hypothetical protein